MQGGPPQRGCSWHRHPVPSTEGPTSTAVLQPHVSFDVAYFNDKDLSKYLPPADLILTRRQAMASHPHPPSNINLRENFLLSQFLFVPWMGCHAAHCW